MNKRALLFTVSLMGMLLVLVLIMASQPFSILASAVDEETSEASPEAPAAVQETVLTVASYNGQPGYQLGPSEQATIYLPVAARGAQDDLNTTIFVQNTAGSTATITATFYFTTGIMAHTFTDILPAHGSADYEQATMNDLPYGFEGSATIVSDESIRVVTDIKSTAVGGLLSYNGVLTGAMDVVLFRIMRDNGGYNTDFWVQNLGAVPAEVTMEYVPATGYLPASITDTIPSATSHIYRQAEMPELGSPWIGSVRVQASEPIAVIAEVRNAPRWQASAYGGMSQADADFLSALPRQQRNAAWHGGIWNSGLLLLNMGTLDALVDFYCYRQDGSLDTHTSDAVEVGVMYAYYPIACSDGFDGAQVIESTQPLVVTAPSLELTVFDDGSTESLGQHRWANELYLPHVAHISSEEVSTEFSVQNPISVVTSITMTYYDHGGFATSVQYDTIPAYGVHRYDTADMGALGSNWEGTVSISASQPVAVEVVEFRNQVLFDRQWLFLLYLNGDNDLAEALWPTLAELTAASAMVPDAQVLVLWDGVGANDTALYRIADGTSTPLTAPWLSAEADMGDPQTLVDFVQWARTTYPGVYTVLSLLDHGGGWSPTIELESRQRAPAVTFPSLDHYRFKGGTGMSWDLNTGTGDSDYLSTAEMRTALETLTYSGTQPIDVLLYDACLMDMLEEAHDFGPYVDFFVASENEAWASNPYGEYLEAIEATTTPAQLATAIVAAYETSLQQAGASEHPYTLAALDLSYMDTVSTTFDALAEALLAGVGDATLREQVYTAYSNTQKFDSDSDLVLEPDRESYVDLYDLALTLAATVTDTDVVSAANALLAAWNAGLVLNEVHGSGAAWFNSAYWDLDDAHGLSVYLPLGEELTMVITHTNGLTEEVPIRSLYGPDEAPNAAWREFINAFVASEWPALGAEALPARPVAYLDGPRPGLLEVKKGYLYLPLILRGSH